MTPEKLYLRVYEFPYFYKKKSVVTQIDRLTETFLDGTNSTFFKKKKKKKTNISFYVHNFDLTVLASIVSVYQIDLYNFAIIFILNFCT